MRSLFDHDGDRGESADKNWLWINNLLFAAIVIVAIAWLLGYPIL